MKLNLHAPNIQHDLNSAAKFIDKNTPLSAKVNQQNQIELKTEQGLTVKRLDGQRVAEKMNQNKINTYV